MARSANQEIGELFEKHGAIVYHRALRLLGRRADAEDAVQEVFIRAMRGLADLENQGAVSLWLSKITVHHCLDLLRQRTRRRLLFEQNVEAPDEQNGAVSASDLVLLRQLLSEADEQQSLAVAYVYLDDMSHEQAAELLGVSRRSVANIIDRFLSWAQKRNESTITKLPAPTRPNVNRSSDDT